MVELERNDIKHICDEMYNDISNTLGIISQDDLNNPIVLRQIIQTTMSTIQQNGNRYGWSGLEKRRYAIDIAMRIIDCHDDCNEINKLWLGVTFDTAVDAAKNKFDIGQSKSLSSRWGWS